ncbi:MAG: GntR family transcriptional regulator [Dictyoglomus sp.]
MKKLEPIETSLISIKVYEIIRDAIVSGKLPPGTKLTVDDLSKELGVSRTPVKEALVRLEREGLVENIPRRGMYVAQINIEDALEIYELREILEGFAIRKAAERIDEESLKILKELLNRGENYIHKSNFKSYSNIDEEFHKILWNISGNKRLFKILENIRSVIRLLMSSSVNLPGRAQASLLEHKKILFALEKKDPDLAETYMREHISNVKKVVLENYYREGKEDSKK